eukprot:CAMPEP_0204571630 /NCGR_PEP_ID=MMETSP0661-20131031/38998_1 /ASSEMBLY_ACC=CAM_ASM_000606 /TAXON_ID=109239 /ORGANISM="Alexandrium margalefi, Strain AMGDE01CS-322" /LENGTH=182 /DNA_ID=CAMNT_0051579907 /DNA_START=46 /DNA_END=594 /DNA_ORIENTATION=-
MASPFVIQQVMSRRTSGGLGQCSGYPRGATDGPTDRRSTLERRLAKSLSNLSSEDLAAPKKSGCLPLEGVLLKEKGGLHGLAGRMFQQPVFEERVFRLDRSHGALEYWKPAEGPDGAAVRKALPLAQLLAVGQPGPRALTLLFAGGVFGGGQRRLQLRVPQGEDFHEWLAALARYACVTGDI